MQIVQLCRSENHVGTIVGLAAARSDRARTLRANHLLEYLPALISGEVGVQLLKLCYGFLLGQVSAALGNQGME